METQSKDSSYSTGGTGRERNGTNVKRRRRWQLGKSCGDRSSAKGVVDVHIPCVVLLQMLVVIVRTLLFLC
jgi:hypothetical protein